MGARSNKKTKNSQRKSLASKKREISKDSQIRRRNLIAIRTSKKIETCPSSDTDESIDISEILNRTGIFEDAEENSEKCDFNVDIKQYFENMASGDSVQPKFFVKGKFSISQPLIYIEKVKEYLPLPLTTTVLHRLKHLFPHDENNKLTTEPRILDQSDFEIRSKYWNDELFTTLKTIKDKLRLHLDIEARLKKLIINDKDT